MEEDHQGGQSQHQHEHETKKSPIRQQLGPEKSCEQPVRSRWTPKPEQILILESIFNSGMVNPPKDETVRIRKLLEKFGTVGDANVFYWFQNRRSRSRRRQRQIMQQQQQQQEATLEHNNNIMMMSTMSMSIMMMPPHQHVDVGGGGASPIIPSCYDHQGFGSSSSSSSSSSSFTDSSGSSSSSLSAQQGLEGFFSSVTPQMGTYPRIDQTSAPSSLLYPPPVAPPNLNYHSGYGGANNSVTGLITVFINGIATEFQGGPIDIKTVFGEDVMLVHSSGVPLPTNEYGFLMQSLQHGESYFLVSKSAQV